MPLEAVMVCVDNSDFTRNGDYTPTRFEAQTGAVNLVCSAKTQQNPENSVGILTTAGDRVEVLLTPTQDLGRMISELAKINVGGGSDLLRAIQTAQLALKHRQNKNQKQRIVAFVGSPVTATDKELETLGKNLKKNNVSIDLVSFGEVDENTPKLQKLLTAVNSNETSHMLEVPVGPKLLSDVLISSVIINPDGEAGVGGGEGGEGGFPFGFNPDDDPELALALRMSMEEERARQQQQQGSDGTAPAAAPEGSGASAAADGGAAATPADATAAPAAAAAEAPAAGAAPMPMATDATVMEAMGMEDMDEELRQALMLSLQEAEPAGAPGGAEVAPAPAAADAAPAAMDTTAATGDAAAASTAAAEPATSAEATKDSPMTETKAAEPGAAGDDPMGASVDSRWFQDPSFVQELLGSLPGVDVNDPRIQSALQEVSGDAKEEPKDGKDASKGDGKDGSGDSK